MRQLLVRPQFYRDVAAEVEWLARRAGPETAERWAAAVDRTVAGLQQQRVGQELRFHSGFTQNGKMIGRFSPE